VATTTINTEPLDRLIGQINSLEDVDFEPLMLDFRAILERDNQEGVLAGLDGFGMPLVPVTYRPNPNKVKPANHTFLTNNNLPSSWYRELSGPPLAPRGLDSRIYTSFRTGHGRDGGAWFAVGAWEDVSTVAGVQSAGTAEPMVSLDGVPFLPFHFRGEGNLPVRNLAHVRPSAMARAKEALHEFAVKLIERLKGR
jgi:hypothetical protein